MLTTPKEVLNAAVSSLVPRCGEKADGGHFSRVRFNKAENVIYRVAGELYKGAGERGVSGNARVMSLSATNDVAANGDDAVPL